MRRPFDDAVARGGVVVELEQRLTGLLREDGVVVGIEARRPDGSILRRRAPVTVLATGGYAANLELLADAVPGAEPLVTGAPAHSSGDGLLAARRIGAAFRGTDKQLPNTGGIETAPGSHRVDVRSLAAALTPQYRPPREIHVNADGNRFLAEDEPSVDVRERAVAAQPGHRVWAVFDDAAIDGEPLVPPWSPDELRAEAAAGWRVWSAGSIEELAGLAGIDQVGLVATVAAWNAAAAAGIDPLGRRQVGPPIAVAPFYALRLHAVHLVTFGGLEVDGALNVLDEAGEPIEGLYAVGEVLGAATFMGDAYVGGMCVTPAIALGRRLGRALGTQAVALSGSRNDSEGE
jgi:fumarate reductase flavoprotein subunit